jgi:two-component system, response regulator PdtaR
MTKRNSILIVEDEAVIRMALADPLGKQGYEVMEADSGERAMDVIKRTEVDLLVTDVEMPGWQDGIGLALWVREHYPLIKLIIVSGATDESPSLKPLGVEAMIYTKPYSVEEISDRARILLRERVSKAVGGD